MKKFIVYFDINGRKMKTTVFAENEEQARNFVNIHKIVIEKPEQDSKTAESIMRDLLNLLGTFK